MTTRPTQTTASSSAKTASLARGALRVWIVVGAIIIASAFFNVLGVLAPVIEFLAVGSLVAFVASPVVNMLEHHGCPRGVGALMGLFVVIAVIAFLLTLLLPTLTDQVTDMLYQMPRYLDAFQAWATDIIDRIRELTSSNAFSGLDDLLKSLQDTATRFVTDLASDLGRGVVPVIGGFANTLFTAFLGLVLAYWLARDYPKIHREIGLALGEEKDDDYRFIVAILSRSVGGYMRSMIITSVINGVLVFLGLTICHHPYAGLMGMLTALFHLIPVVGPVFSSAIAVVVAFFYGPALAFWTLVITVVAQNITDNVISPKVMQSTVQVHPAMSLAAIVIGSALMGPLGMVVAIPLCAALKGLFIFYYEKSTKRQLVDYDGAIFQGTPFRDEEGHPVPAFDALGDDKFVSESEILTEDVVPEAAPVPKPELDNPWQKLSSLQPGATGVFRMPFISSDDEKCSQEGKADADHRADDANDSSDDGR